MTGSNHIVAGALIAAVIPQPLIAIPLAFLSHFLLDALPHFGDTEKHSWLNRNFSLILLIDTLISAGFLLTLMVMQPDNWGLMVISGLVAVSPDALWLPYYLDELKGITREHGKLAKLFKWIQWGERPWGLIIEAGTLVVLVATFAQVVSPA